MYRGDDKSIDLVITQNGSPFNISGATIFMTIKPQFTVSDDTTAIGSWTVTNHTYPNSGMSTISITNTQSNSWTPGTYWYDIQYKSSGATITTFVRGRFVVADDVTRRTS